MAQISYGTITITDTTDIERIYPVYCKGNETNTPSLQPLTNWSENVNQAGGTGDYIWQRIVTKKQGIAVTANDYSDAVRLTGDDGSPGQSVDSIVTTYCNYGSGTPAANYSGWQSTVPAYDSTKPNYWVKTVVTYSNPTDTDVIIYKDNGITSATSTAAAAWSKADQAQTDAGDALSQATAANNATALLGGHFIYRSTTSVSTLTPPSANVVQTIEDENGIDVTDRPDKWQYNTHIGASGIKLRYNEIDLSSWTDSGLAFYNPSTSSQGQKMMELAGNGLFLYRPLASGTQGPPSVAAQLTTTGLNITEGSITLGSNGGNFKVTNEGVLMAKSGTIGGWHLGNNFLSTNTNGTPGFEVITLSQGINLSPSSSTQEVDGVLPINKTWTFTVSNTFGITQGGALYASGAQISGTLTGETIEEINTKIDTLIDTTTNQAVSINKIQTIGVEEDVYVPTQDGKIVANKNYYTRSGTGTEQDPYIYTQVITPVVADIRTYFEESTKITGIVLSKEDHELLMTSDRLTFKNKGEIMASLSNQILNIASTIITSDLTLGPFKWVISTNRLILMRS